MKHLIFDAGGVLVYPHSGDWVTPAGLGTILGSRREQLRTKRYLSAREAAARWLDESQLVPDIDAERRLRREYLLELNARMDWRLTDDEVERLTDDFTDNMDRYGFFDDIGPWLTRWKGNYGLGLLSDAMPSILAFLDRYGVYPLFDAAVISTQVGAIKPSPRMYEAILRALGAEPGDCLFVDDKVCNLEGALRSGMSAVQMARVEFMPERLWEGPVVHSFEALNRLISDET